MKRLLAVLLVCPALALASETCPTPSGWADDESVAWSSWSLEQDDATDEAIDWEQRYAEAWERMAEEMGLTVEEVTQFFAEMEQRSEAVSGQIEEVEVGIAQVLAEQADLLAARGDAESLVRAALLTLNQFADGDERAQAVVGQALHLAPSNPTVQWLAVVTCNQREAKCSAKKAAHALVRLQPDNIAAWWALASLDVGAGESALSGAFAADRYTDASDALAASLLAAYADLELPTTLQADLERVMNHSFGMVAPVAAEHVLLMFAAEQIKAAVPADYPIRSICRHTRQIEAEGGIPEMEASTEACRQHYTTVIESARTSAAQDRATDALITLAGDDEAEVAYWQRQRQQRQWLEFQMMKAQTEGRVPLDRAYFSDVLEFGELEAARLHLAHAGIAVGTPPEDWDQHKATMQWMGEWMRQAR